MFYKKILIFSLLLIGFIQLSGCASENSSDQENEMNEQDDEPLTIFTTIYPLQDFAEKIGGDYVEVKNMIPAGSDAHTFEPTPKDMIEVAEADMFFYNGAGLEGFVNSLITALEKEDVTIVEASKDISLATNTLDIHEDKDHHHDEHEHDEEHHNHDEHEHDEDHHHDGEHHYHDQDPHIWLDPLLAIKIAENITESLIEVLPEQKEEFKNNYLQLKADLEELDHHFEEMVMNSTKTQFIVSHAGYGYWETRYGLEQIGITGLTGTDEPSLKQIQAIIEMTSEYSINHIMFEQNIPSKMAEVVQSETNTEPLYLHNLEVLMPTDIEKQEDYFSLMNQNIEALREALQ
ncbi:metal ABC transporter metal-binding protein [Bacillus sp. TS-2]|nr:metal ABC transporter metal-binding protein [Bacillus sp. TS-2]